MAHHAVQVEYGTNAKDSAGVRHIERLDAEKDRPSNFATLFAPVQDPAAAAQ